MEKVMVDGVEKTVINRKETMLAQQKQDAIREAFQAWMHKDSLNMFVYIMVKKSWTFQVFRANMSLQQGEHAPEKRRTRT